MFTIAVHFEWEMVLLCAELTAVFHAYVFGLHIFATSPDKCRVILVKYEKHTDGAAAFFACALNGETVGLTVEGKRK